MKPSRSIGAALTLLLAVAALGSEPRTGADFAQSFFDWYGPIPEQHSQGFGPAAWNEVIKSKANDFKPSLLRSLKAAHGFTFPCDAEISPDFDPFLGSKSLEIGYLVGEVTLHENVYTAQVYQKSRYLLGGRPDGEPEVVAIFEWQSGKFQFVNFEYPDMKTDLLTILKPRRKACEPPKSGKTESQGQQQIPHP